MSACNQVYLKNMRILINYVKKILDTCLTPKHLCNLKWVTTLYFNGVCKPLSGWMACINWCSMVPLPCGLKIK